MSQDGQFLIIGAISIKLIDLCFQIVIVPSFEIFLQCLG